jgi:hypothetical protein
VTPPLPDRIAAAIDEFGEAATTQAQAALEAAIAEVVAERDSWMHSANVVANEAQQLRTDLAAAQAKLADVDRKRQILADIAVEAAGWLAGLAGRPSCSCDPGDLVKRLLGTAQSWHPAQRDDDGTASGGGAQ